MKLRSLLPALCIALLISAKPALSNNSYLTELPVGANVISIEHEGNLTYEHVLEDDAVYVYVYDGTTLIGLYPEGE